MHGSDVRCEEREGETCCANGVFADLSGPVQCASVREYFTKTAETKGVLKLIGIGEGKSVKKKKKQKLGLGMSVKPGCEVFSRWQNGCGCDAGRQCDDA